MGRSVNNRLAPVIGTQILDTLIDEVGLLPMIVAMSFCLDGVGDTEDEATLARGIYAEIIEGLDKYDEKQRKSKKRKKKKKR